MKKLFIVFALLAGVVSYSKAQGPGGMGTPEERIQRSMTSLDPLKLTDDQKAKAKTVFMAQSKLQDSMMTAMQNGGDPQSMMPKFQEMRASTDKKIMDILNDEQKKAYAEIVKNRPQRGMGGGGGFGGGQPPQGNK